MSIIAAGTTTTTALSSTGNTDGTLQFQVNGTTPSVTLNTLGAIGVGSTPNYGTSGQVLTSGGSTVAPTWSTISSGGLTLVSTITPSNGVASAQVTGLSSYKSFIVVPDTITLAASAGLRLAWSADNGATYSNVTVFTQTNSTQPKGTIQLFRTDNASSNKVGFYVNATGSAGFTNSDVTGTINAFQISTTSTFTGVGSVYIYGMN